MTALDIVIHLPFSWHDAAIFGAGVLALPILLVVIIVIDAMVNP